MTKVSALNPILLWGSQDYIFSFYLVWAPDSISSFHFDIFEW